MAPNPQVSKAFRAMKELGISEHVVKPVLKKLLKVFESNWTLIEQENYRALADAIFEFEETKATEQKKKSRDYDQDDCFGERAQVDDDVKPPLKKLRLIDEESPNSPPLGNRNSLIDSNIPDHTTESQLVSSSRQLRPRGKKPALPQSSTSEVEEDDSPSLQLRLRDKGKEPLSPRISPRGNINEKSANVLQFKEPKVEPGIIIVPKKKVVKTPVLMRPKDEPTDDIVLNEIPIAILPPEKPVKVNPSVANNSYNPAPCQETPASQRVDGEGEPAARGLSRDDETSSVVPNGSVNVEVALPEILRLPPSINGVVSHLSHEKSGGENGFCGIDKLKKTKNSVDEKLHKRMDNKENKGVDEEKSRSLVLYNQNELTADQMRSLFDRNDITRGEEIVKISLVNEINKDQPPSFHYIPKSLVFQNAYVNFSLARIGDEDCCSTCFGDCLSSAIPCACARETGGEFAYTKDGLVKEGLLEECISMNRDPEKHKHYYCKECPLERSSSDEVAEPCKGHLVRKFIKECWSKCGCTKQCGNRVVQRGITCKLQIFMSAGKGWGIRTLEDLPKGAFVFEYVGEIITNAELYERNTRSTGSHSYPVLLDADWGAENVLKDEEALCLDATHIGNVARFLNHRCLDANMVEIPVEVETPDHHYYHLAFFTTRKVDAMEEMTWDYGIDFDDHDHPVKAFRCKCGSKFCRNMKRSSRSRR